MPSSSNSSSRKKKGSTVEDALEQKLRKKKQQEKSYQDKLEAKIKQKQKVAYNNDDDEEEKLEEGMLSDEYGYKNDLSGRDSTTSSKKKRKKKKKPSSSSLDGSNKSVDNDGQPLFTRGGGDVRNKPPPSLEDIEKARNLQQNASDDPLRRAEAEAEQNKKKVNPKFADLHETGQWGGLNKWEKYGICLLTLGVIGVAIWLGIQFGGGGGDGDGGETGGNANTGPQTRSPTLSPSAKPTLAPTVTGYRLTTGLSMMKKISPSIALPNNPEALKGAKTRSGSTPQMLAAEFILYDDARKLSVRDPTFLERYALAVFYFANGGCSGDWITRTNWMDPVNATDHCGVAGGKGKWHGVFCSLKGRVTEIKMNSNYVTWKLPREFVAFTELSTLEVSDNRMVGELPSEAISMPKLFTLLLNNNDFEGVFPFDVVKQGAASLDTLWIQENSKLVGSIPTSFCSLGSITLDCANFQPQPVYVSADSSETTFEADCLAEPEGVSPREYTCNTGVGVPIEKPADAPVPAPRICGTPAAGT